MTLSSHLLLALALLAPGASAGITGAEGAQRASDQWRPSLVESPPSMAFLKKGFPVMPGHWGGWHFATFPTIAELLFLDNACTRAVARVRVGYAGGDVLLEKQAGAWKATKLTQTWVE